jgi:hypothetical protein
VPGDHSDPVIIEPGHFACCLRAQPAAFSATRAPPLPHSAVG